jgi:hypothetical protein
LQGAGSGIEILKYANDFAMQRDYGRRMLKIRDLWEQPIRPELAKYQTAGPTKLVYLPPARRKAAVNKAFEYESRYDKNGRPERRWSVGAVLVWGVVALVLGLAGKAFVLPSILPQLIGK